MMHGNSAFVCCQAYQHERLFRVTMIARRVRGMRYGPEDHTHTKAFFKPFRQVHVNGLSDLGDRRSAIIGQARDIVAN